MPADAATPARTHGRPTVRGQSVSPPSLVSKGDDKADHERPEPRVDKTLQRGEPERSSPVAPDAQDPSQADRDTSLQDVSRTQQATNPAAAVRNRERDTGPSR